VLAVGPARDAVAGWLGIGAVKVRRSGPPVTSPTTPTTPGSTEPDVTRTDLAAARKQVDFEIVTPRGAPPPAPVLVDRRIPGGLVVLTYDHSPLVEIPTDPAQPLVTKFVGSGAVEAVTVHGHAGMWIPRPHQIGYIDRSGQLEFDTVRRSGPVLLWER